MIRKKKKFMWPRKLYDKPRILDENKLVKKYGLKNKREIWKTEAKVNYFRTRAKALINESQEDQKTFFNKLNQVGLKVNSIADVLSLGMVDLLERRLSTVVYSKGLASTPRQARQMIVHKKILMGDKMVSSPSYLVKIDEEKKIKIKKKAVTPRAVEENNTQESNELKVEVEASND